MPFFTISQKGSNLHRGGKKKCDFLERPFLFTEDSGFFGVFRFSSPRIRAFSSPRTRPCVRARAAAPRKIVLITFQIDRIIRTIWAIIPTLVQLQIVLNLTLNPKP